jgi:hypothetical protein
MRPTRPARIPRAAVGADAESLGAGAVLDRGRRRHPDLGRDVSSAVGALENEMHAQVYVSAKKLDDNPRHGAPP